MNDDDRTVNCAIAGCLELADILPLDELDGAPYCFDHFELMLERWQAIELAPNLRATLPEIPHRRQWLERPTVEPMPRAEREPEPVEPAGPEQLELA
jgi:hypothetical protein